MLKTELQAALETPWVETLLMLSALVLSALFVNFVVKRVLLKIVERALSGTVFGRDEELRRHKVIPRLANIMPALVISIGAEWIPGLPASLGTIIVNVANAFMILTVAMAISGCLAIMDTIYHRRPESRMRPIKGYVQVAKIGLYILAAILMASVLTDRSPTILLGGLGAMAAVLLLVFQDTILSFVAGVQILSNDLLRVGDWISMPSQNADGTVIEVGLHIVKVRNWDHTISTIPVRKLASESFKNWRGMTDGGVRRIKRSIHLDQTSTRFLDHEDVARLSELPLLKPYLDAKLAEISEWNASHGGTGPGARRLTNIGTFRAYMEAYLRARPDISNRDTLMVRQSDPTSKGLPIEVYCFTTTTVWTEYEGIQSDIFDHILSILPLFDLRVFQDVSGADLRPVIGETLATQEI
jgi:miniconductance mechanosensitive channel